MRSPAILVFDLAARLKLAPTIWIADEHLIRRPAFAKMKEENRLGLGVQHDGEAWLADVRQMLYFNLQCMAHRVQSAKLDGAHLEAGTLIVKPTVGEAPAAAEDMNAEISDLYPMIEVLDLLREVHDWTGFVDQFTRVHTGDSPRNVSAMLAGVLAYATNLGPKRMTSASKGISVHQIGWMRTFHARSETYRAWQACITDRTLVTRMLDVGVMERPRPPTEFFRAELQSAAI